VVTQAGSLVGKLTYLSPEQFRGREASPAGDVFGLGVVLYELATGRHPYGREQGQHPIAEEPGDLVPLAVARPDLPRALCAVVDEALAFDPWNRFKNANEMERGLALARNALAPEMRRFDLGDWLKALAPAHWDDFSLDAPVIETRTAPHEIQEGTQG
jgi:serine/threonine protein kinase